MVYVRLVSVELKLTLTYINIMEVTSTPSVQFLLGVGTSSSTSASPVHDSSTIKWPKCTKTYNSRWETDPLLKTWISRHPDDIGKVVCNFCQSVIRAHKNDLLEHTRTLKHQRNFMAHATPEQYNQFVMELNELRKDAQLMSKKKVNNGGGKNSNSSNWTGNNGHGHGHGRNNGNNSGSSSSALTILNPLFHSKLELDMDGAGGALPPGAGAGGLGPGGCGDVSMDIWPSDMNNDQDSFLSADSPSDLVSVILEEQEQDQDQDQQKELNPGSPQLSGNSNESFPPTLTPNHPTHSSLSPSPSQSQHHHQQQQLTLSLLSSASSRGGQSHRLTECVQNNSSNSSGQAQRPFTCGDVLTAMEGNYFSWTELWSLAKCALGIIESGSDGQIGTGTGLSAVGLGLNNGDHLSPQPPHIHIQPSSSHSRNNNNSHPSHTITINTNTFPPSFQTNSRSNRITPVLTKPRTIRRGATSITIGRRKPKPKLPSSKLNLSRDHHILHVSASAVNCSKGGDQDGDS